MRLKASPRPTKRAGSTICRTSRQLPALRMHQAHRTLPAPRSTPPLAPNASGLRQVCRVGSIPRLRQLDEAAECRTDPQGLPRPLSGRQPPHLCKQAAAAPVGKQKALKQHGPQLLAG